MALLGGDSLYNVDMFANNVCTRTTTIAATRTARSKNAAEGGGGAADVLGGDAGVRARLKSLKMTFNIFANPRLLT